VCDAVGDIAALAWKHVHCKPVVCEASSEHDALIADLGIQGVWQSQAEALFNIQIPVLIFGQVLRHCASLLIFLKRLAS